MLEKCPVCENNLIITRLYCDHCGTTLSGQFGSPSSKFSNLNSEQLKFLETFIRCEGKFNRMEEELNVSYPTIKNRFSDLLKALGYDSGLGEDKGQENEEKISILQKLDKGEISPEEADKLLRG